MTTSKYAHGHKHADGGYLPACAKCVLFDVHEAINEEIARIENTAEQARYGGDALREYQLSSIARRLRKLVSSDSGCTTTEAK